MVATAGDLQERANRLFDALDAYDQFVAGWPYESTTVPAGVRKYLASHDEYVSGDDTSPGIALTTEVVELYYEACEMEADYVQQAREQGRSDWDGVVTETELVREAARQVHVAGYGVDSDTGEKGYLLPKELCPARLVSMNAGSSPVTFSDRVAQYRAVADHFDLAPSIVYHPGSGHDVSPSMAFPESRVVYVDVDVAAMNDLTGAGYEAVGADATGHELTTGADVIVFRNAGLVEEAVVNANLRPGGWVLANDHLESARHLKRVDSLELVGAVPHDWTGEPPPVESADLNAYLSTAAGTDDDYSTPPFEKGTPLDLYVFRDGKTPL